MEPTLKRKGRIAKNQEGNLVLINEDNQGFRVDEVIAAVWYESDGKTISQLVDKFSEEDKENKELIRKDIEAIIEKLKEVKLVV
ncbi:MAG: PqqD family protein [Candidatus Aenigmarchaeota archaeon]|nr:PqqD family protein [Candidatus Aenigmarchaeota archaeon]